MAEAGNARPLSSRGIVVTRPVVQAKRFAKTIEDAGGRAILFPVIEIHDTESPTALSAALKNLRNIEIAIFVSPNAVRAVASQLDLPLPESLRVAAIGLGTKRELEHLGISKIIVPQAGFDSESLLGLPEMQSISGKRVVIFRGSGGRDLLRDGLIARGAEVNYVECYRRVKSDIDPSILFYEWRSGRLDAISVTSVEGLRNLVDILGEQGNQKLKATPLFVPHQRIAGEAAKLGIAEVIVTGSGDETMLVAMISRFSSKN